MELKDIKFNCAFFKGYMPCIPNKRTNVTCENCSQYNPVSKKILIIKLGAIGDVIRTTPLVTKFRTLYPHCHITWLTLSPNVLPEEHINVIYKPDAVSIMILQNEEFDIAINLDKDKEACILLTEVHATLKYGFIWKQGHIDIATQNAKHKLITGLFDQYSKENTKSYLEEIFEICHLQFDFEEYLIKTDKTYINKWQKEISKISDGKIVVGLNTGCGERWKTRLWPKDHWIKLIDELSKLNYFCLLLGGEVEHELNKSYAQQTKAFYPGHFSLEEFIALCSSCDIIVTQVSMMMHIATALKKQMILFNNIFNKHEFELYGRGVILEPVSGCDCYYGNTCTREKSCMNDIFVDTVIDNINILKQRIK